MTTAASLLMGTTYRVDAQITWHGIQPDVSYVVVDTDTGQPVFTASSEWKAIAWAMVVSHDRPTRQTP